MPSDDRSRIWHIVIHHTEHYNRDAILAFAIDNEINLTVQEDADTRVKRLHYHLAKCYDLDRSRDQIKLMIKKSFPLLHGKKDYTTHLPEEDQDWNGLLRYLSKGKGPNWESQGPIVIYNWNQFIDVQHYHADFWRIQQEWKDKKEKEAKDKNKEESKTRQQIVNKISAQIEAAELDSKPTIQEIIKSVFVEYKGACDTRQLFVASQMVLFNVDRTYATDLATSKVYNMFF